MQHIDGSGVRDAIQIYVWQATHTPLIKAQKSDNDCIRMVERITDLIVASNQGIIEHVVRQVNGAPNSKKSQRWRGWRKLLRRAVHAYMDGLYNELDVADVYLQSSKRQIDCKTVIGNSDCMTAACRKAAELARARSSLYGWVYFKIVAA